MTSQPETRRTGKKDGVPYKETVALRGAVRGGELHACHPDVVAIVLCHPRERKAAPIMYVRGCGAEMADADGHDIFLQEEMIEKDMMNIVPQMRRPS